jgi:acetolactate synthase-1/2/3 large subunit
MNTATALVEMLHRYEVQQIFGVPGDTSLAFYEALRADGRIGHIMARDERTAGFMADAYARLTARPGVCEAPSGAGATYLLPGLAEATGSSVPFLALTSDVPVGGLGRGMLTALDQEALMRPVSKWTTRLLRPELLPETVRRAFRAATTGRPGAAHLSLPEDVLHAPFPAAHEQELYAEAACRRAPAYPTRPDPAAVAEAAALLRTVSRPVILAGGGAVLSGCQAELVALAELLDAPVATTITGKGAIAETHPLSLGVAGGNGGRPYANIALATAPLVLMVGCKANEVATQRYSTPRRHGPPIIHIDVDPQQLGNTYPLAVALCGDARLALADLVAALASTISDEATGDGSRPAAPEIANHRAQRLRQAHAQAVAPEGTIHPLAVIDALLDGLPADAVLCADAGTPTPYTAAYYTQRVPGKQVLIPRAHGGLGYAIPATVGACVARPGTAVVGLCGDGSFAMSAAELETITRLRLPVILLHFNNGTFGWIKALQALHEGGRYFGVDFTRDTAAVQIAAAHGWAAQTVATPAALRAALADALAHPGPTLLDLPTPSEEELMPPVAAWQKHGARE